MSDFGKVWALLWTSYPEYKRKGITAESCAVYERILSDVATDVLMAAAIDQVATNTWFPTVADLRTSAFNITTRQHARLSDGEAWGLFMRTCKLESWQPNAVYEALKEYPALEQTARQIGIRAIAQSQVDTEGVHRAHFLRMYNAIVARADTATRMVPEVRAVADRLQLAGGAQHVGDVAARLAAGREKENNG